MMPIDRLIVVAGPKGVGKSQFIESLRRDSLPELAEALKMGDPSSWQYRDGVDLQDVDSRERVRESPIERLVLHYEITGPWNRRYYASNYQEDRPLEILDFSNDITVVTLWAPCDVLLERFLVRNPRFQNRWLWLRHLYWHGFHVMKLDADFRPLYRDPELLLRIFSEWLAFCQSRSAMQHWLVDSSDERYSFALLKRLPADLFKSIGAWSEHRGIVSVRA
jgi:hypothetical protein